MPLSPRRLALARAQSRTRWLALARAASVGGVALAVLAPGAGAQTARPAEAPAARPAGARPGARLLDRPVRRLDDVRPAEGPEPAEVQAAASATAAPLTNPFGLTGVTVPSLNAKPSVADLDGDGDLDVLSGERYGNFAYYENTAGPGLPPVFSGARANPFGLTAVPPLISAPNVVDLDGDGDVDVLAGGVSGSFAYFENTAGAGATPAFAAAQTNPFGLSSPGDYYSTPSVADLDGDGDLDVLAGVSGSFVYFENTAGAGATPAFAAAQTDPFGLSNVGPHSAPSVADLDGDGDLDVISGESYGSFVYFENTADPGATPAFAAAQTNPFGLSSPGYSSAPSVADLDGDGDLDVLAGTYDGPFVYFENTGHAAAPAFAGRQTNPFGLSTVARPSYASAPTMGDLDGDGDLDVLAGDRYGSFLYYENTAGPGSAPVFSGARPNPFGLSGVGLDATPTMVDLDGDGDIDVLAGNRSGDFAYFENTAGVGATPAFAPAQGNPFGLTPVPGFVTYLPYSAPSVADLDGDGDLDVISGEGYGSFTGYGVGMVYYENTAGPGRPPAFAAPQRDLFGTGTPPKSTPVAVDGDGDGDLDVLSGTRNGGLYYYYENTAGPGRPPTFPESRGISLGFGPDSKPSVADLDGDGTLDLLVGTRDGSFLYFADFVSLVGTRTAAVAGDEGWRLLAAPADGASVGDLLGFTHTQGFPGADYDGSTPVAAPTVYLYDESVPGARAEGYRIPDSAAEALPLGRGLAVYLFADDDLTAAEVQGGFPKTLSVTGAPASARFGWGAAGPGPLSYTDTDAPADDDGWNLLGNPFASWFDWDAVELSGVEAPVYVYDDALPGYRSYSTGVGNLAGGIVGPFQGFWVHAVAPGPGLVAPLGVSSGGPLYRQAAPLVVGLKLAGAGGAESEAFVVLGTAGAAAGRDALDALALVPLASDFVQVATVLPDAVGLSVDHQPALVGRVEVPLAVRASGTAAGRAVLSWPTLDGVPDGVRVRLLDRETGAEVDLASATEYAFTLAADAAAPAGAALAAPAPEILRVGDAAARTDGGRFALVVAPAGATDAASAPAGAVVSETSPNPARGRAALRLTVPAPERVRATVYDALGREVALAFDGDVSGTVEIALDAGQLAPGAYVVRVEGQSFAEVRRMTVVR